MKERRKLNNDEKLLLIKYLHTFFKKHHENDKLVLKTLDEVRKIHSEENNKIPVETFLENIDEELKLAA